MRIVLTRCLAALCLLSVAPVAQAGIIWDYSPDTTGGSNSFLESIGSGAAWSNRAFEQNFADIVSFTQATTILGMDIYTSSATSVGTSATIRLWDDVTGVPSSLLSEFTETISIVDTDGASSLPGKYRLHVNFSAPMLLAANTIYWIGMSGTNTDIGQYAFDTNAPGDGVMYQFSGTTLQGLTSSVVGDMSFRLFDTYVTAAPEPSTLISASIAGLGAIGLVRSRRRRMA